MFEEQRERVPVFKNPRAVVNEILYGNDSLAFSVSSSYGMSKALGGYSTSEAGKLAMATVEGIPQLTTLVRTVLTTLNTVVQHATKKINISFGYQW